MVMHTAGGFVEGIGIRGEQYECNRVVAYAGDQIGQQRVVRREHQVGAYLAAQIAPPQHGNVARDKSGSSSLPKDGVSCAVNVQAVFRPPRKSYQSGKRADKSRGKALKRFLKAIPYTAHGMNHRRIRRVGFKLFAQPSNMHINRAI